MLASLAGCVALVLGQVLTFQPPQGTAADGEFGSPLLGLVSLAGQRITVDIGVEPPELTIHGVIHNRLPVALDAVELGALLAGAADQLENIDAGRMYASDESEGAVTVVRRTAAIVVPAGGSAPVAIRTAGEAEAPTVFVAHLLGFSFAEVRVEVLTALLATGVAADEVAATNALAIGGAVAAKRRVRERWAADRQLVGDLRELLSAPIAATPDAPATLVRVFAALGLGVIGGDEARVALETFGQNEAIDGFDESLQVLRAARLTAARLEAPVAYALPADARTMKDVVAAAVGDLGGWSVATDAAGDAPRAATTGQTEPPPEPTSARRGLGMPLAILVGVVVFFATWLLLRRRQ